MTMHIQVDRPTEKGVPRLRTVIPADIEWVIAAMTAWHSTYRWSMRGRTPGPELVGRMLWEQVMSQFVIDLDGRPVGLIQFCQVDLQSAYGYLAVLLSDLPQTHDDDLRAIGAEVVRRIGRDFPLRKLYVEVLADETAHTASRLGWARDRQGNLEDHERRSQDDFVALEIYSVAIP